MKYLKIYSGFNDQNPISIDETELQKAIYAQITGKVALLKNGTIAGSSISKILPDFDKVNKIYNPNGPDRLPKGVEAEHYLAMENAGEVVKAKIENRTPQLKQPEALRIHTKGPQALGDLINKKQ